jgi:hypothetical protein
MLISRTGRAGLILAALAGAGPVAAAPVGTADDVRCLLLSAGYARQAKEEGSRRASAMTGAFFLGRLDGRLSPAAIAAVVRAQGQGLPAKDAEPAMRACAARAAAAERAMTASVKAGQAGK